MERTPRTYRGGGEDTARQLNALYNKRAALARSLEANQRDHDTLKRAVESERGITAQLYELNIVHILSEQERLEVLLEEVKDQVSRLEQSRGAVRLSRLGKLATKLRSKN